LLTNEFNESEKMSRPKLIINNDSKEVMTLTELHNRWAEFQGYSKSVPVELQQIYPQACRRGQQNWEHNRAFRIHQLTILGLYDTHVIDYYENTKPIIRDSF